MRKLLEETEVKAQRFVEIPSTQRRLLRHKVVYYDLRFFLASVEWKPVQPSREFKRRRWYSLADVNEWIAVPNTSSVEQGSHEVWYQVCRQQLQEP